MRAVFCTFVLALLLAAPVEARADDAQLTGDWGGLRSALSSKGFDVTGNYIGETFANLSGGIHRGTIYEDRISLSLDIHPEKFSGWTGATWHVQMFQIDGHGPSANLVGNLYTVSGLEALPSTRLFTLWLEQQLVADHVWLRLGQLALDDEFIISGTSANLINATFGNPQLNALNMIGGGPAYPLAQPGARIRLQAGDVSVLAAAFSANPGGSNCQLQAQICNPSGTTFSLSGGTLWVGEIQYAVKLGGSRLPGTYKLGGWREVAAFPDLHLGIDGIGRMVSLASPGALRPLFHGGDYALYGVADQMLWKKPGTTDQGISAFLRIGGAPQGDRNLIQCCADAGMSWKGLFPGRESDIAVVGAGFAKIGSAAIALDRDLAAQIPGRPVRNFETLGEISYLAQIRPWCVVQPDLQYVAHPGGNQANPSAPLTAIHNALLLGLRTTITF